ncbi:MAG TPA: molybdopterin cofactor-binding domain-containing protein [Terracidiphilus sp.]|nr:molybdopterin cofactor-binding domain-containing protein [Terracidiphilus sp.]
MTARNAYEVEMLNGGAFDPDAPLQFPRRDFLKLFSSGLLIALAPEPALTQQSGGRFRFGEHRLPQNVSAWIHIAPDNRVTVFTGKIEAGQNIRTSLAQQVAEELRVPFDSITMIMGDTARTPWDMGTFGSRTTPTMGPELRTMASAARDTLLQMAADQWHADASTLQAANARVTDPAASRSATYGELTQGKEIVKVVSGDPALTPAADWKIAGTPVLKAEIRDFVTGRHVYPSDVARPGMLHGAIVRPAGYHATLQSLDTSAAEKISGVQVVHDGEFIGIVAPDYATAHSAAQAVKAKWNVPAQPSNAELFSILKKGAGGESGNEPPDRAPEHQAGNVPVAYAAAPIKIEQEYTVQYIQHVPLEPRAAVAEWKGEGNGTNLTVWTGTQRPFGVQEQLIQEFNLKPEQVRVSQPDMGSGYGGKHTGEAAIEAARLAKAAGHPVKIIWTREEEFTWAYFRPAGVITIRAGAGHDGKLTAWEMHNYNSGGSALPTPYDVPNQLIQYHPADGPLRQGSYRSLAAAANNFARESHMDSLAHAANLDPLEFRLRNLSNPRMRAVLQAAADKFHWAPQASNENSRVPPVSPLRPGNDGNSENEGVPQVSNLRPGTGHGIACGTDKGGYVATCAEISIDPATKKLHIVRVTQAWESGAVINPDGLRNQQMGAVVQAIGGALFEQILFANGKILNPYFAEYRVPRFKDAPQIEIVLLDRKDLPPAGAGEIGLIGLAPAVANAWFAATGTRLHELPMAPKQS